MPWPTLRCRLSIYLKGFREKVKGWHNRAYQTHTITKLCEMFLIVHNCIWIENISGVSVDKLNNATKILFPERHRQDSVRFQESCELDLMSLTPSARSNLSGYFLKMSSPCFREWEFILSKICMKRINTVITGVCSTS